jgi:predicted RNA-binding protein with PIN domain
MRYLIDGYNLLYAIGLLHQKSKPQSLKRARLRLLDLLHHCFGTLSPQLTIVFDSPRDPEGKQKEYEYQGIHVRFAVEDGTADDLIESIIGQCPSPDLLSVVSDDRRIQHAADRKGCPAKSCSEFLDELEHIGTAQSPAAATKSLQEKSDRSAGKREYWLEVFGDLENDPALKELSAPAEWFQTDNAPSDG